MADQWPRRCQLPLNVARSGAGGTASVCVCVCVRARVLGDATCATLVRDIALRALALKGEPTLVLGVERKAPLVLGPQVPLAEQATAGASVAAAVRARSRERLAPNGKGDLNVCHHERAR